MIPTDSTNTKRSLLGTASELLHDIATDDGVGTLTLATKDGEHYVVATQVNGEIERLFWSAAPDIVAALGEAARQAEIEVNSAGHPKQADVEDWIRTNAHVIAHLMFFYSANDEGDAADETNCIPETTP